MNTKRTLFSLLLVAALFALLSTERPAGAQENEVSVEVDPSMVLSAEAIPGYDEPRIVAGVENPDGTVDEFVVNEVVLHETTEERLEAFMTEFGGTVLSGGQLPEPPDNVGPDDVRHAYAQSDDYLLRIELDSAEIDQLPIWMAQMGLSGEFRFSSEQAIQLAAILAKAQLELDLLVSPNMLAQPHDPNCVLCETEEHSFAGGNLDAFTFPAFGDAQLQASRAWQYLDLYTGQSTVNVAILDQGFALNNDFPPTAAIPQYDFINDDHNALGIRDEDNGWHGTGALSVAAAQLDNQFGAAGTGAQVIRPMIFHHTGSFFGMGKSLRTAIYWGADVTNLSWGGTCNWWCRTFSMFSGAGALYGADNIGANAGVVMVASAGNDERNLDSDTVYPCELGHTLCVGAFDQGTRNAVRNSAGGSWWGSNYGSSVDIWAPGRLMVATPDPDSGGATTRFNGTSAAAPWASGVIAGMLYVHPSMTPAQVRSTLQSSANTSSDTRISTGFMNAYGAIRAASIASGNLPQGDQYEPNDTSQQATTVFLSNSYTATISPNDWDYYNFETVDYLSGQIYIVFSETSMTANELTADLDGTGGSLTGNVITIDVQMLKPGKHELRIRGTSGEAINCYTIEFQLSLSVIAPDRFDDEMPTGEVRNDSLAAARLYHQTLMPNSSLTGYVIDDLNHDTTTDIDYFSVQLSNVNSSAECLPSHDPALSDPRRTQGFFEIRLAPDVYRAFDITVYTADGSVFMTTRGTTLRIWCPHSYFANGELTFSVKDAAGRNFYDIVLTYNHTDYLFRGPDILFDPGIFIMRVPSVVDQLTLNFPFNPDVQATWFEGGTVELSAEYLTFEWSGGDYLLNLDAPQLDQLGLRLLDENGLAVWSHDGVGRSAAETTTIDIPDMPEGRYFLEVNGSEVGTPITLDNAPSAPTAVTLSAITSATQLHYTLLLAMLLLMITTVPLAVRQR